MFEIGWTEMLVIAVVMIVVVGPKDLPKMLRTFGRMTTKMRSMAGDFQRQFNDALKEAELDDVKKSVDSLRSLNPTNEIRKQLNPFEKAAADVRAGLSSLNTPKPASTDAQPAEPLKGAPVGSTVGEAVPDAAGLLGVSGPSGMPAEPPTFPPMSEPVVAATAPLPGAAAPNRTAVPPMTASGASVATTATPVEPKKPAARKAVVKTAPAKTAPVKPAPATTARSKSAAAKPAATGKTRKQAAKKEVQP